MNINYLLYFLVIIKLTYSIPNNEEKILQKDTCFLLSSKTSKIQFKPIEVVSNETSNYLIPIIIQKNSTGQVGMISINNHLIDNNNLIWFNISLVRDEDGIAIDYTSNLTKSKIIIPARQTKDLYLFIELDLNDKYLNGYTYDEDNRKLDEVNFKIKVPDNVNRSLSKVYVTLGAFNTSDGGFIGEVDFKYLQVDGKKYFLPNDKVFGGDIAIEERCTQLDDIKSKKSLFGICTYSDKKKCLNGGVCEVDGDGESYCVCPEDEYTGRYCQFSLLPKTCTQISPSTTGIYKIDVDGSDIGEMGYVKCENGKTIVSHNFPPNMVVRNRNITHNLSYDISYKFMSNVQIRNLIERSQKCQQLINYSCYGNAPLNFKDGRTSFENIYYGGLKPFYQLGDTTGEYQCSCGKNNNCLKKGVNCNCDIMYNNDNNNNETRYDTGIFNNKHNVGIKRINIYGLESQISAGRGLGLLNISDLTCYGDIGYENDFTLSFTSPDGILLFYRPVGRRVEFEFRLPQPRERYDILEFNDKEIFINLFIINNKEFNFVVRRGMDIIYEERVNFTLINVNNNEGWHNVILELNRHQFKISIDDKYQIISNQEALKSIEELMGKNLEFKLHNFIGCVRAFYVDDGLVNLSHELSLSKNENIFIGCKVLCKSDTCQHDSKCIENIKENSYKCECKNENIYYGDHCQFTINEDTDISFLNPYEAYIGYDSKKSLKNMTSIYQNITMSFRTDQRKALLLFGSDEINNFIQIHLTDEFRIILSMNHGNISKQCTVHSGKGEYFNNMEWKQIQLKHYDNNVTLYVDDEYCTIDGSIPLTKTYVVLDGADDEIVIPPILPGQTNVLPYKVLYIGGVPRQTESGELITWSTIYNTRLPSILGCIRGLKFSSKFLDLRNSDLISSDGNSIKKKCQYESCKQLKCQNKGYCSVRWFQEPPKETFCDCSKTSFYGRLCEQDDTIKFATPSQQLSFDMSKIRRRYDLFESKIQTFKFAFSSGDKIGRINKQMLSMIQMDNGKENIEITLESDNEISVNFNNEKVPFEGNFTDGYRHFLQLYFDQRKHKIWVVVDGEKKLINHTKIPYNLARTKRFVFGNRNENIIKNILGYSGFISNIDINYHKSDHVHFMPLKYYKDPTHEYYECINVKPNNKTLLLVNYRSSFEGDDGEKKEIVKDLQFPPWDVPVTINVIKETLNKTTPINKYEDVSDFNYTILIIAIITLLLILILFIIIGICVSTNKGNRKRAVPIIRNLGDSSSKNTYVPIGDQLSPLNVTSGSYYPNKDDCTLPEPLIDTDPVEMIPPLQKHPFFYSTSTQLYFTAQESLSSDLEDEKQNSEGNNDDDPLIKLTDYEEGRNSMIYIN